MTDSLFAISQSDERRLTLDGVASAHHRDRRAVFEPAASDRVSADAFDRVRHAAKCHRAQARILVEDRAIKRSDFQVPFQHALRLGVVVVVFADEQSSLFRERHQSLDGFHVLNGVVL